MDWKEFKFNIEGWDDCFLAVEGYIPHASASNDLYELMLMEAPSTANLLLMFSTVIWPRYRTLDGVLRTDKTLERCEFEDFDPLTIRCVALDMLERLYPRR